MKKKTKQLLGSYLVLALVLGATTWFGVKTAKLIEKVRPPVSPGEQAMLAGAIIDYYYPYRTHVKWGNVYETIKWSEAMVKLYFPHGPFHTEDLVAMAMIESHFNPRMVGKHGELGIFQVKPQEWGCFIDKRCLNPKLIPDSCQLACLVLKTKLEEQGTYKRAIIAYNGYVCTNGRPDETYWRAFQRYRKLICSLEE